MPTMEDWINSAISAILGAAAGFVSSYFFWQKQRQLDRPRIVLELDENAPDLRFVAKNKGGSFAENVQYVLTHFSDAEDSGPFHFDDAVAPGETRGMHLNVGEYDSVLEFRYDDVFGRKHAEAWDVHYDENMGEPYYIVMKREVLDE